MDPDAQVEAEPLVWCRALGPLGPVLLTSDGEALTGLHPGPHDEVLERCRQHGRRRSVHPVLAAAAAQVAEYLAGERREFELPVALRGPAGAQAVWAAVRKVPYGEVVTARELAETLGATQPVRPVRRWGDELDLELPAPERTAAVRGFTAAAVARAAAAVAVPLVVPAHRLVRADGMPATPLASRLLALERGSLFGAW